MTLYRKKPVTIEAWQWAGDLVGAPQWIMDAIAVDNVYFFKPNQPEQQLMIRTLEGVMAASAFDYIIRGVRGELYPCKPDIFAQTYEPADDEPLAQLGVEFELHSDEAKADEYD